LNSTGGLETQRLPTPGQMETLAFHPKANLVAVAGSGLREAGEIRLFDLDRPDAAPVSLRAGDSHIDKLAFSPDGKTLAAAGYDRIIRLFQMEALNQEPAQLTGHEDRVFTLAFSADGKTLASGSELSGKIYLWDVRTQAVGKILNAHGDSVL